MQLTYMAIRALFPDALDSYVSALAKLEPRLAKHGILGHPLHLTHFLAQCAAETGGFSILAEGGNYSAERLIDGILEEGEEGEAVAALQRALLGLGYLAGEPDGVFGERTHAAVAAFQARECLPAALALDRRGSPECHADRRSPPRRHIRPIRRADCVGSAQKPCSATSHKGLSPLPQGEAHLLPRQLI